MMRLLSIGNVAKVRWLWWVSTFNIKIIQNRESQIAVPDEVSKDAPHDSSHLPSIVHVACHAGNLNFLP